MAGFNAFLKNNNIITGTAIPTEGNFKTGDIIVNVGPNSATEPMWICNEGGNPGIWGPVGVGSGSIVSINSSVLISEPTNEISLASLGVGVSSKDKLLVHYNSTHLLEGVHFEISNDGSKIVKLGEGNWNPDGLENCIFALELFKGVESIDGDKIVVDSKMTSITNHVVIENACSEVEIGIEGFNAGNDTMLVFKNGVNMVEGVDYEVQGGKIVSTGEVWNENGIEDYGITFVVFKEVVEYDGSAEVKAENIADGSIGIDKLGEDVREAIEAAGNIDLSGYATKEELNELFQDVDSGKTIIADAIDDRNINKDSTFAAMGEAIENIHADREEDRQKLIEILQGSNMDLSGNESMDTLLDLIDMSNLDLSKVVQIACGYACTMLLYNDGTLWACGTDAKGGLGLGSTSNKLSFTQVTDVGNDVKQVSCCNFKVQENGFCFAYIVKNDGSLWSCGSNYFGQLGLGNNDGNIHSTFTQVTTNINNDVKQVSCGGAYVMIVKNDGSLWGCGLNNAHQMGIGGEIGLNNFKTTFTQVTTNINNDVKEVICGDQHTFIIKNDGSIWSCGNNRYGQLGNGQGGSNVHSSSFTKININNVKQIAGGPQHTVILKNDGSVWSCGYNSAGQLGLGASDTKVHSTFTQVTTNINNDVKQIACGQYCTFIIKNDSSLWSCGLNNYGQLGLGTSDTNAHSTFTKVTTNINNDVEQVASAGYSTGSDTCGHVIILKNDGSVWGCGYNASGQLGLGNNTNQNTFMSVNQTEALQTQVTALQLEATTNRGNLATVLTDEGVNLTGDETLADLITKVDEEFTKLETNVTLSPRDIKQVACGFKYTLVVKNDGTLWATGNNNYGQLGLGDTTARTTFTKVTTNINNDVKQVACGENHTLIVKNDGSLWACGYNNYGQLGNGGNNTLKTFTKITNNINNDVKEVICGRGHTYIIKNDGTVWSTGKNTAGELGLNNTTNKTLFTQVTTNVSDVKQIACGYYHTYLLKNDGTVYACGDNSKGQLGLGNTTQKNVFTTVNITNVKQISCHNYQSMLVKNDGTLWACGDNTVGQLGFGSYGGTYNSFTKVTANVNNDVKQIACGYGHTIILKNNGSLWSTGYNDYGQLSLGDAANRPGFNEITSYTNNDIKQIYCGDNHTFILTNDGSVWCCGYGEYGQLGLNDVAIRNVLTRSFMKLTTGMIIFE